MANGSYAEACAKFDASYEMEPKLGALLNRAACREKVGQTATAWALYREAIGIARGANNGKLEKVARDRAAALEPRLRYLTILVHENAQLDGLVITRNDSQVDPTLWNQRLPVNPGNHEVRVEAPGFVPHTEGITLVDQDVEIEIPRLLARPGASQDVPQPNTPSYRSMSTAHKLALASGAVAAAGLFNGGLFALHSRSKTSAAETRCTADFRCTFEGVRLANEARKAADVAYISYGIGLVTAAAGAVLWFRSPPHSKGAGRDTSAQVIPMLYPDLVGLNVEARF